MPLTTPPRRRVRPARVLVALAAVASAVAVGVVPIGPSTTPKADAYLSDTVSIEGHGFGHGRGMGQYGALGYALNFGWDHRRILAHFYGGTEAGTRPNTEIDVHLRLADAGANRGTLDGRPLVVDSGQSFSVGANSFAAAEAARITRTPAGWTIERGPGCQGPWTVAQSGIDLAQQPTAVVDDPSVGNDISRMIQVCAPSGRRHYRGTVRAIDVAGESKVVNRLPIEDYLRGVVPRESPASWGDLGGGAGLNQLRAQAVAARSYAWAEGRAPWAKTCDTTSCQVYGGAGLNDVRIEDSRTDRAVAETAGEVRLLGGAVARTEFSSSTGGHSAGGVFPAVLDEGDAVAQQPQPHLAGGHPRRHRREALPDHRQLVLGGRRRAQRPVRTPRRRWPGPRGRHQGEPRFGRADRQRAAQRLRSQKRVVPGPRPRAVHPCGGDRHRPRR